jgi:prolyl-tRNA synthetase
MRLSTLLGRTTRQAATRQAAADTVSHDLLHRAGYVRQHAAGIYTYLALGLRALRRLEAIVREEMDATGAQEILMPAVHDADVWRLTGRYDTVDDTLVRFTDRRGHALVLGMTHEEVVAQLAAREIQSYRQLDLVCYQIQTKFRDEARPRGGLLRTREFLMKDAYSLHLDDRALDETYERQAAAYARVFRRAGLRDVHRVAAPTGDMGGRRADEFQCLLACGEDTVLRCGECGAAVSAELLAPNDAAGRHAAARCVACGGGLEAARGVEVGNIFQLGTRYTDPLDVAALDAAGARRRLVMGSYGIGVSRLLACLVEQHHDARGIALPAAVAPADAHLVSLGRARDALAATAAELHAACERAGLLTLWDDRDARPGEQLADADLVGATARVVLGAATLAAGTVELVERRTGRAHVVALGDAVGALVALRGDLLRAEGAVG